jgi:hypothetical protein
LFFLFRPRRKRRRLTPEEKIEAQAKFAKKHIEGIADNTNRRVKHGDSYYMGMIRGRQLSLEWALREIRGEDHDKATDEIMNDNLEERLFADKT